MATKNVVVEDGVEERRDGQAAHFGEQNFFGDGRRVVAQFRRPFHHQPANPYTVTANLKDIYSTIGIAAVFVKLLNNPGISCLRQVGHRKKLTLSRCYACF